MSPTDVAKNLRCTGVMTHDAPTKFPTYRDNDPECASDERRTVSVHSQQGHSYTNRREEHRIKGDSSRRGQNKSHVRATHGIVDHEKHQKARPNNRQYNMNIPIYRRYKYDRQRETVIRCKEDDDIAWDRLNCVGKEDCYYQSYGSLFHWGYPRIMIVGSSHVKNMAVARMNGNLPERCYRFIRGAQLLGVGGLMWWRCSTELNGVFVSKSKGDNYGNVWEKYDRLSYNPDYSFVICGSNDTSDLNCRLLDIRERYSHEEYLAKANIEMNKWFNALKPHIDDMFDAVKKRTPNGDILYLPILPRRSWLAESRKFAIRLNEYVIKHMPIEKKFEVIAVNTKSLLHCKGAHTDDEIMEQVEVISTFLEDDGVHLSLLGYEALLNDLSLVIANRWGKKIGGTMWSEKRIKRKKFFCRLQAKRQRLY